MADALFNAVRLTLREQRLVSEPFLHVGIIATIKELVLLSITEDLRDEGFEQFRDGMIEIGVLVGVTLVLSTASSSSGAVNASLRARAIAELCEESHGRARGHTESSAVEARGARR